MVKNKVEKAISDFVIYTKYSNHIESENRRQNWKELVDVLKQMYIRKFPNLESEIEENFELVYNKQVLPSMRSLHYGGFPIEINPARIYNCGYGHCSHRFYFAEAMFLLLSGCGLGSSVRSRHVNRLDKVVGPEGERRFLIGDSIEGWADSIRQLMYAYLKGNPRPRFDYRDIRPKGSKIKKAGGIAPGPEKLIITHEKIEQILKQAVGRKLTPLECFDILGWIAKAVISGGIRESAMIILFDVWDSDMATSKGTYKCKNTEIIETTEEGWKIRTELIQDQIMNINCYNGTNIQEVFITNKYGDYDLQQALDGKLPYYYLHPQRSMANISAAVNRNTVTESQFKNLWYVTKETKSGEPGIYQCNSDDEGTNPCFSGDMKLLTDVGYKSMKELWEEGGKHIYSKEKNMKDYGVMDIINSDGIVLATNVFKTGENADVYEIKLSDGGTIKSTLNHNHFIFENGMKVKKKLCDINIGDEFILNQFSQFGNIHEPEYALSAGWIIGDGSISKSKRCDLLQTHLRFFESDIEDVAPKIIDSIKIVYEKHQSSTNQNPEYNLRVKDKKHFGYRVAEVNTKVVGRLLMEDGLSVGNKHVVPKRIFTGDKITVSNFLKGLFSADGTVNTNYNKKSISIRLTQNHQNFLKDVKLLLAQFSIKSSIHLRRKGGNNMMNGGKGGQKLYRTKDVYDIIINGIENCKKFMNEIGFLQERKNLKAWEWLNIHKGSNNSKPKFLTKVLSIEYVGKEDTYCLNEPINNEVVVNGYLTSQCGEINFNTGEYFCNLTSTVVYDVTTQAELNRRVKSAAFIGTLQATFTDFHYLRPIWKERTEAEALLGVSMTGIASGNLLNLDESEAANIALMENERVAKIVGINKAARVTTLKPEGSGTWAAGVQGNGVHWIYDHYYIRNNRIKKKEPIYKYITENFPQELYSDEFLNEDTTAVVSFPMKAPDNALLRPNKTAIEALELVARLHKNWIQKGHRSGLSTNNVSCTINVRDNEWDEVIEWLWDNRNSYNAISLFPYSDHIYKQAPFQSISEAEYEYLYSIFPDNLNFEIEETTSTINHSSDNKACIGGVCEI